MLNTVPEEENSLQMEVNADTQEPIEPQQSEQPVAEEIKIGKPVEEPATAEAIVPEMVIEPTIAEEEKTELPVDMEASKHIREIEETVNDEEDEDDEDENQLQFDVEEIDNMTIEELVELLETTVTHKVEKIKAKVAAIRNSYSSKVRLEKNAKKQAFIDNGGNIEDYKDEPTALEYRYEEAFKTYKTNKNRLNELLEKQKQENVALKTELLTKLKELIDSDEPLKKTYDSFKEIQDTWKKIGPVPQSEINNLWQNYHFYVEKFFDKVKINKELRDLDFKKNLEQKIQLCEKVEELLLETSINKSFKLLQQYHEEWKSIGPISDDKKEEVWERFKNASDTINQRRKEHYEEIQGELQNNYNAKLVLCDKAEDLTAKEWSTIKEWNDASEEVTELLKVWKTLGPAPKKLNDEVWEKFKSKLDFFFASKKAFLQKVKENQLNNYNLKIDICLQAEAIKDRTDWKKATEDLLALQKEWKEIGSVPKKYSDQIWKRFRAACDSFFEAKSAHFSNQHEHEDENLKAKEELLEKIKAFEMSDDRNANLNTLKEFQRQWMEIGHVPTQEKDRLYKTFKELVNKHWEVLKATSAEHRSNNYKNYVNDMLEHSDGGQVLDKERRFLQNKMTKLREDIAIWENNLGFFSNSKNAQILIQEFEKKIELAKQELKNIEDKIKILQK